MQNELYRCLRCRYLHVVHDGELPSVCHICQGERFVRILIGHPVTEPVPAAEAVASP